MNARNLLIAVLLSGVSAISYASTGTMTFLGYIAEDTCQIDLHHKTINAHCPKTRQSQQFHVDHVTRVQAVPLSQGNMKITWLDNTHKKGIITLSYR